jgi:hypothetical protein
VESGALILLDIAAEPAKAGQPRWNRCASSKAKCRRLRYGRRAAARTTHDARRRPRPARNAGGRRADALCGAEPLRAAAHRGAVAGIGRVNLRRDLALDTLLPTLPVRAQALAAWRLEDQWVTAVKLTNTSGRWLDLDPRALQGDFSPRPSSTRPGAGRAPPTPRWSTSSPVATAWPSRCCRRWHRSTRR